MVCSRRRARHSNGRSRAGVLALVLVVRGRDPWAGHMGVPSLGLCHLTRLVVDILTSARRVWLALHPPVIGPPVLDRLFNLLAVEFFVQRALGELRDFCIGGEAQSNELILSEFWNARAQRLGKKLH